MNDRYDKCMKKLIKLENTVRELVAANRLAVYHPDDDSVGSCLYASGKAGECRGCLIGHALKRSGLCTWKFLTEIDSGGSVPQASRLIAQVVCPADPQWAKTELPLRWFDIVQGSQDCQETWGEALDAADLDGFPPSQWKAVA